MVHLISDYRRLCLNNSALNTSVTITTTIQSGKVTTSWSNGTSVDAHRTKTYTNIVMSNVHTEGDNGKRMVSNGDTLSVNSVRASLCQYRTHVYCNGRRPRLVCNCEQSANNTQGRMLRTSSRLRNSDNAR